MTSTSRPDLKQITTDINILSRYLACQQVITGHDSLTFLTSLSPSNSLSSSLEGNAPNSSSCHEGAGISLNLTTIILAGSAILHTAHEVFSTLRSFAEGNETFISLLQSVHTLVITGGKGHSTMYLHDAIARHPVYNKSELLAFVIGNDVKHDRDNDDDGDKSNKIDHEIQLEDCAEATLLNAIFHVYYRGSEVIQSWTKRTGKTLNVLVEDKSTNCGANAVQSCAILKKNKIFLGGGDGGGIDTDPSRPEDVVIVQDPTMSRRTLACFHKVYESAVERGSVHFWCWPTFVPTVTAFDSKTEVYSSTVGDDALFSIAWHTEAGDMAGVDTALLWSLPRFYGLLLGEIPRLRDDKNGYGPNGRGFIGHVDIPQAVHSAWERLVAVLEHER